MLRFGVHSSCIIISATWSVMRCVVRCRIVSLYKYNTGSILLFMLLYHCVRAASVYDDGASSEGSFFLVTRISSTIPISFASLAPMKRSRSMILSIRL